jgi:hypothetical protein
VVVVADVALAHEQAREVLERVLGVGRVDVRSISSRVMLSVVGRDLRRQRRRPRAADRDDAERLDRGLGGDGVALALRVATRARARQASAASARRRGSGARRGCAGGWGMWAPASEARRRATAAKRAVGGGSDGAQETRGGPWPTSAAQRAARRSTAGDRVGRGDRRRRARRPRRAGRGSAANAASAVRTQWSVAVPRVVARRRVVRGGASVASARRGRGRRGGGRARQRRARCRVVPWLAAAATPLAGGDSATP